MVVLPSVATTAAACFKTAVICYDQETTAVGRECEFAIRKAAIHSESLLNGG